MPPPTSHLPPIHNIASQPAQVLLEALRFLRQVYTPEIRGSRRPQCASDHPNHGVLVVEDHTDLLRSDAFERSYALKWLTALISQVECWETEKNDAMGTLHPSSQQRDVIIQETASLLAICAGAASAGTLTRAFAFTSTQANKSVMVQLRDVPLENHEYASVGAQTWGSACVLSEQIVEAPHDFGLIFNDANPITNNVFSLKGGYRVLELGAGTGLVSLTLGKLLEGDDRIAHQTTIIATDFYPSVLTNLEFNIMSNFSQPDDTSTCPQVSHVSITPHFLDWAHLAMTDNVPSPFDEPFDLILGADIVYEPRHATWIQSCLQKLLRKPISNKTSALFHLIIPIRPTHTSESNSIEQVFLPVAGPFDNLSHPTLRLGIISREIIVCDAQGSIRNNPQDRNEVVYAYYKIGWHEPSSGPRT